MRRLTTLLVSAATVAVSALVAAPAHADAISVTDVDTEAPPLIVNTEHGSFTNRSYKIAAEVVQSDFLGENVQAVSLDVDVPGRTSYSLSWSRYTGSTTVTRVNGHGDERTVRCGKAEVAFDDQESMEGSGSVRFLLPQKCLENTKRVRFRYYIVMANGQDTLPGSTPSDLSWTQWVGRRR